MSVILVGFALYQSFQVDQAIISDIALISLYCVITARNALNEVPIETKAGFFSSSYQMDNRFSVFEGSWLHFSQFFTFDFLISTAITVSVFMTLPLVSLQVKDDFLFEVSMNY